MKLEKMIHSEEQERGVEAIVGGTKDQSSLLQQQLRLLGKTLWQEIEIEGEINLSRTKDWAEKLLFHIINNCGG